MPTNEPNDWVEVTDDIDDWEEVPVAPKRAPGLIEKAGNAALRGAGEAVQFVDRFTGAPIRAAVGAAQDDKPIGESFVNQFMRPASTAPSGKDIMAKAGMSTEDKIPLPFRDVMNRPIKASPAGLAGGVAEAVMDPTTYIPAGALAKGVGKGAQLAGKMSPKVAGYLEKVAATRAAKAVLGQNKKAFTDLDTTGQLEKFGKDMLAKDEAGKPVVGWLTTPESALPRAKEKRQFYGDKISDVEKQIDSVNNRAVDGHAIADKIDAYKDRLAESPNNDAVRSQLEKQAEFYRNKGQMSFAEAQTLKNGYIFKPGDVTTQALGQKATNELKGIVGKEMESAVDRVGNNLHVDTGLSGLLGEYKGAKSKYGSMAAAEKGAKNRVSANKANRFASPSDYAAGGVGMLSMGPKGIPLAILNKIARERGSAFAARSADALSRKIMAAPDKYRKWLPGLQAAAATGSASLVTAHHVLMNNDPEYRKTFEEGTP